MSEVEIKAKQYADYLFEGEFETPVLMFKKADIRVAYMQGFEDATKWHYPSKGEYPTDGQRVIICMINDFIDIIDFSAVGIKTHIKAWMPLPEPPKEEA